MGRVTHRLTAVKVENLKTKGLYPDGDGLYLRVTASGSQSWIYRYHRNGRNRDMGLGPTTSVSLAKARQLAADARRLRLDGADPITTRNTRHAAQERAERTAMTFKACAEQLMNSREAGWRNAKHRQQWRNTLKTYAYPLIGDLAVGEIDTQLITRILEPLWTTKPETASRLRGRLEAVLDWAKARGYRDGENAARWRGHLDHLLPPRKKVRRVRHHAALPYADVPSFLVELREHRGIAVYALEFLILTAARTSEALGALWSEIDFAQRLWTVPGERMKMGIEHRVPLPTRVVEILRDMSAFRQSDFVFPGQKQQCPLSNMALLMLIRDMRPGVTVHGFRSSFRDWAAERTSTPNFIVEAALAHAIPDRVEAAYRRSDLLEKRRKLMVAWGRYCVGPIGTDELVQPVQARI